jgi:hypothetical protein
MKNTPVRLLMAAIVCVLISASELHGQTAKPTEYQVKAVYLYNFGRFVTWPARAAASASAPFTLCVLGEDPFGAALDQVVAGETIGHAHVIVQRISKPQEAAICRVLFISSSRDSELKDILAALNSLSILIVSDMPEFAERGGMIQFVLDGSRVRFEVNLAAAERAGLSLSSEMLRLATHVRKAP